MRKNIVNIVLTLIAVAFLTLLALRVRAGDTVKSVAILKITGITCKSCTERAGKALQGIKGVAATEADLDHGRIIVGYDPGKVRAETLTASVKKAGFDSIIEGIVTPERFRQVNGRDIGSGDAARSRCCGG